MRLIVLAVVIYTFFNPDVGSVIFLGLAGLLDLYIFILNKSKIKVKLKKTSKKYTQEEIKMIEKYHIFFRYPTASRMLSSVFSAFQLSTFIMVPLFLYKGLWIQSVLTVVNYFISSQFAVILNPQFFLHDNVDKNKIKDPIMMERYRKDMHTIDSALEKLYSPNN